MPVTRNKTILLSLDKKIINNYYSHSKITKDDSRINFQKKHISTKIYSKQNLLEIRRIYNYLTSERNKICSPVGISYKRAEKELHENNSTSIISWVKVSNLAVKKLLNMAQPNEKWEDFLTLKVVKEIQQTILNNSLLKLWQEVSPILNLSEAVSLTPADIRSWLENPKNQPLLQNIVSIDLSSIEISVIPPEIKHFTALKSLHIGKNDIKDFSFLRFFKDISIKRENSFQTIIPSGNYTIHPNKRFLFRVLQR